MKLKKSAVLGIMLLVSAAVLFTGCGNNSKDTTGEKTPEINYMTKVLDAFSKGDLDSAEEYNSNLPKTVEGLEGRDAVYYKEDYENVLDSEFSSVIEKYAREDNSAAIDIDKDGTYEFIYIDSRCNAEAEFHVFALRDNDVSEIGTINLGGASVHQYPGENGIILNYCHMNYQHLEVASIDGDTGKIKTTEVGDIEFPQEESDKVYYFKLGCKTTITPAVNEEPLDPMEYMESLGIVGSTYSELDEKYGMTGKVNDTEGGVEAILENGMGASFSEADPGGNDVCSGVTGTARDVFGLEYESSVEDFIESLGLTFDRRYYDEMNYYWYIPWNDIDGNEVYISFYADDPSAPITPKTKVEFINKGYF